MTFALILLGFLVTDLVNIPFTTFEGLLVALLVLFIVRTIQS